MSKHKMTRVKLDPQQAKLWQDTLAALSWIGSGFVHIMYTLLHRSGHPDLALFTEDIEFTAATDGTQVILKPSAFFKLTLMQRCFVVLHEVFHEILNHIRIGYGLSVNGVITLNGKTLPFVPMWANIVQDYVINAILVASKLGTIHPAWLYDLKIATDRDTWIDVYFREWKHQPTNPKPKPGNKPGDEPGTDAAGTRERELGRFDDHMEPGASDGVDPHEAPERNEAQWEIVVKQGMELQEAQGTMPAALKLFFEELLKPKVEWTEHIRGLIMRLTGSGAYDFRRLDRRLIVRGIGAPGETGRGAGLIVVGGDSSGSIAGNRKLVDRFLGEVGGMIEDANPEEAHVIWCDAKVQQVNICTDISDVRRMAYEGVIGGGGTDFRPVFEYVEEHGLRPDVLIYLTDMFGSFPEHAPDYPVIWASISPGVPAPFGTIVDVPLDNE